MVLIHPKHDIGIGLAECPGPNSAYRLRLDRKYDWLEGGRMFSPQTENSLELHVSLSHIVNFFRSTLGCSCSSSLTYERRTPIRRELGNLFLFI